MRRDAGRHTDSNALCAVDQQMGDSCRKNTRFFLCLIKVWNKIHDIFVQIRQQYIFTDLLKSRLRISHGSSSISFDRTKVTMSVDKRQPFFEILAHNNQCLIDGAVSMRMIFTHGIANDTGTFSVRAITSDAKLMHIVESPSLYRLQTVPHIRQCTGHDNAHGIVNIRLLHDIGIFCFYDHFFTHAFPPIHPALRLLHFHR